MTTEIDGVDYGSLHSRLLPALVRRSGITITKLDFFWDPVEAYCAELERKMKR